MKRYTIFLLAIAFTSVIACRKEHNNTGSKTGGQRVSFTVSGNFTGQIIPQGTGLAGGHKLVTAVTPTIQNTFDTIFYRVYDLSGNIIHSKTYSAKTFTGIVDTLQNGDYKIAIYAGTKGFNGSDYGNLSATVRNRFNINTFGNTFPITVGGSSISQTVTINRVVGELTFTINDAIPAGAKKLTATPDADYTSIDMYTGKPTTTSGPPVALPLNLTVPATLIGTTGYTFTYVSVSTAAPFNVTLVCNDATTQVIAFKKAGPITLLGNEHLSLSGNLFTSAASGNQGTTVAVDTTWSTTVFTGSF